MEAEGEGELEDDCGVEVEVVLEGLGSTGDGRRVGMATVWCGKNAVVFGRQSVDCERQDGKGLSRW